MLRHHHFLLPLFYGLIACQSPQPERRDHRPADGLSVPPTVEACGLSEAERLPPPRERSVYDVATTGQSMVALTEHGARRSVDGGEHWSALAIEPGFVDADEEGYVALARPSRVWLGDVTGEIWREASVGLPDGLVVDHIARRGGTVLAVAGGQVHRWDEEAGHWHSLPPAGESALTIAATDGEAMLASSEHGLFQLEEASWTSVPVEPKWAYTSLSVRGQRRLASSILSFARSDDGGQSWALDEDTFAVLGPIEELLDAGPSVFAMTQVGIFESTDGGLDWRALELSPSAATARRTVVRADGAYLMAAGDLSTRTDGSHWEPIEGLRTPTLNSLLARHGQLYVAAGRNSHHWTEDGWRTQVPNITSLTSVGGSLYAVARGSVSSLVLRSNDNGHSWTELSLAGHGSGLWWSDIVASDDGLVLASSASAVGAPVGLLRSRDGGQSWVQADVPDAPDWGQHDGDTRFFPAVTSLVSLGRELFALMNEVGLLRSTDGGRTWQLVATEASSLQMAAAGETKALFAGHDGRLLRVGADTMLELEELGPVASVAAEGDVFAVVTQAGSLFLSTDQAAHFERVDLPGMVQGATFDEGRLWLAIEGRGIVAYQWRCR